MKKLFDPTNFFRLALHFEASLALAAVVIGWLVNVPPLQHVSLSWPALLWGVLGTVPMFALFVVSYRLPNKSFRQIRDFLVDTLGPNLAGCRWHYLLALAFVAGFSEELLFRGLLQPWIESSWGWAAGLIGSNILFGLAHFITPLYAVVAAGIGIYLGLLLDIGEERNLLTPIIVHALYDFLAFLVVVKTFRAAETD